MDEMKLAINGTVFLCLFGIIIGQDWIIIGSLLGCVVYICYICKDDELKKENYTQASV